MEINEQQTPIDEPVSELKENTLIDLTSAVRGGIEFNHAENIPRHILNSSYDLAISRLHKLLDSRHPASWILEAYKQIFMWTAVYKQDTTPWLHFDSPKNLAPVGRQGWRYAIEYLLSKNFSNSLNRTPPSYSDVSEAFTLMAVCASCAEWSNLIHFFPDIYNDLELDLDHPIGILTPVLSEASNTTLIERARYMQKIELEAWNKYTKDRSTSDTLHIESILSTALETEFKFTIDQIRHLIETLARTILSSGFIISLPGPYFIEWASDESGLSKTTVKNILDFMLLSAETVKHIDRNFLDKKNPIRMINFAGVRIDKLKHLRAIYPKKSSKEPHIKQAKWHITLNMFVMAEWFDIFTHKYTNGQRQDLKGSPTLNAALEKIEQYQRKNVFESVVEKIFIQHGVQCVKGLKKWRGRSGVVEPLTCGEIDILGYHNDSNILFVAECKAGAPATDSRGFSQQKNDHFKQKKYHAKFLSKIAWTNDNLSDLHRLTELSIPQEKLNTTKIIPILTTRYPSIVKFYIDEYTVCTFGELEDIIKCTIGNQ